MAASLHSFQHHRAAGDHREARLAVGFIVQHIAGRTVDLAHLDGTEDICKVDYEGKQLAGTRKRTSEVLLHLYEEVGARCVGWAQKRSRRQSCRSCLTQMRRGRFCARWRA